MSLPDYVSLERRSVKWARLEVQQDGRVLLVVPRRYSQAQIQHLLESKQGWMQRKRAQMQQPLPEPLQLAQGQLLLHGEPYQVQLVSGAVEHVDRQQRRVYTAVELAQPELLQHWYRAYARVYLSERTAELAKMHAFGYNRLSIRAQRTRWGSCSAQKNISLNWKLVKMPCWVSDYVILHELVHTRRLDHSPAFWREVARVAPEYEKSKRWLRAHGRFL